MPGLVAAAAEAQGRPPVIFAIDGEANPEAFGSSPVHAVRWGEIGRFLRLLKAEGCEQAIFVDSVAKRPDFKAIRPDFGAVRLMPRILRLMRRGDNSLLSGVAEIFLEHGVKLVSPLDVAPHLALPEGVVAGQVGASAKGEHRKGGRGGAADRPPRYRAGGCRHSRPRCRRRGCRRHRGIAWANTHFARRGRIGATGGVLVKCMKPQQDRRLDLPTIGPTTAEQAFRAGLEGVAGEAGAALLVGHTETVEAFQRAGPVPRRTETARVCLGWLIDLRRGGGRRGFG